MLLGRHGSGDGDLAWAREANVIPALIPQISDSIVALEDGLHFLRLLVDLGIQVGGVAPRGAEIRELIQHPLLLPEIINDLVVPKLHEVQGQLQCLQQQTSRTYTSARSNQSTALWG